MRTVGATQFLNEVVLYHDLMRRALSLVLKQCNFDKKTIKVDYVVLIVGYLTLVNIRTFTYQIVHHAKNGKPGTGSPADANYQLHQSSMLNMANYVRKK